MGETNISGCTKLQPALLSAFGCGFFVFFVPVNGRCIVQQCVNYCAHQVQPNGGHKQRQSPIGVGRLQSVAHVGIATDPGQSPKGGGDSIHNATVFGAQVLLGAVAAEQAVTLAAKSEMKLPSPNVYKPSICMTRI